MLARFPELACLGDCFGGLPDAGNAAVVSGGDGAPGQDSEAEVGEVVRNQARGVIGGDVPYSENRLLGLAALVGLAAEDDMVVVGLECHASNVCIFDLGLSNRASRVDVPVNQQSVATGRDSMAVIWGERQIPDCLRMSGEALDRLARIRVADEDGSVCAPGEDTAPVGRNCDAPDGGGDPGELLDFSTGFDFDEAQGVVFTAGKDVSVSRNGHAQDVAWMFGKVSDEFSGLEVPEAHVAVVAAGDCAFAIGMKGDGAKGLRMPETYELTARIDVPEARGVVDASGQEFLAVGGEPDGFQPWMAMAFEPGGLDVGLKCGTSERRGIGRGGFGDGIRARNAAWRELSQADLVEPAIAFQVLEADVAGASETGDGDVFQVVVRRAVGAFSGCFPLVEVDGGNQRAVQEDPDRRALGKDLHMIPLACGLLGVDFGSDQAVDGAGIMQADANGIFECDLDASASRVGEVADAEKDAGAAALVELVVKVELEIAEFFIIVDDEGVSHTVRVKAVAQGVRLRKLFLVAEHPAAVALAVEDGVELVFERVGGNGLGDGDLGGLQAVARVGLAGCRLLIIGASARGFAILAGAEEPGDAGREHGGDGDDGDDPGVSGQLADVRELGGAPQGLRSCGCGFRRAAPRRLAGDQSERT